MNAQYDFTLEASAADSAIIATLRKFGIVLLPDFVNQQELENLKTEFFALLDTEANWIRKIKYKHGKAVSVHRAGIDSQRFPVFKQVFDAEQMHRLTNSYLGQPNLVNNDIFLTYDLPDPTPINELHFDKIHSLKFFLYLADTTEASGAFTFVPGSAHIGRQRANEHLRHGRQMSTIPNVITEEEYIKQSIPIEGRAGTMIIFDTDGFHRGGIVQDGQERLVMRGHSHVEPMPIYKPKPFSRQWWHEFPLNPQRFSGSVPARRILVEDESTSV